MSCPGSMRGSRDHGAPAHHPERPISFSVGLNLSLGPSKQRLQSATPSISASVALISSPDALGASWCPEENVCESVKNAPSSRSRDTDGGVRLFLMEGGKAKVRGESQRGRSVCLQSSVEIGLPWGDCLLRLVGALETIYHSSL